MSNIQALRDKYAQIPKERFFNEIFDKEEYKPVLTRKLDVVIDAGALAGEMGAYIYDKAGVIYCIEPFSEYYKELEDNINEFGLTKMLPFNVALAGYTGEARISLDGGRGGNQITTAIIREAEIVPCVTLATFMQNNNIEHVDVLKVDIEGGEEEVFLAPDFLPILHKIDYIIGEHFSSKVHTLFSDNGFSREDVGNNNYAYERRA